MGHKSGAIAEFFPEHPIPVRLNLAGDPLPRFIDRAWVDQHHEVWVDVNCIDAYGTRITTAVELHNAREYISSGYYILEEKQ